MATIPQNSWNLWQGGIGEILALEGHNIRIRGRVQGPVAARKTKSGREFAAHSYRIWVDHPEQIEFIIVK
jgi:hypothetical protein